MTHHHFKKFTYSLAGLTLTYVSAIVAFFLVTGIVAQNQERNAPTQTLGVMMQNMDQTDKDLRQLDQSFNLDDDEFDVEEMMDDEDVMGASTQDEDSKDMQEMDSGFKEMDSVYYPEGLDE